MQPTNYEVLKQAFERVLPAEFNYHDHPRKVHVVKLGWKEDRERCLGWQYLGTSYSSPLPKWCCFDVDEMSPVTLAADDPLHPDWEPRSEYRGECVLSLTRKCTGSVFSFH